MPHLTRRALLQATGAAAAALAAPAVLAGAPGRVVVVGGGFGGASAAHSLRRIAPELDVTLVAPDPAFVTCPFSNAVIAGLAGIESITHSFDPLVAAGVRLVQDHASAIDLDGRTLRLAHGAPLPWDRLILSPGIAFKTEAIEGYAPGTELELPHAWQAGAQTLLLRDQLQAMDDGGVVVMTIPDNSFRCPPGPYERACLIAHYLQAAKPRSKLILLDAKDAFSKQPLFQEAWAALYPGLIQWVPFAEGGSLLAVNAATRTVETEFLTQAGDVVNVIPPQRAADLVRDSGLTGDGDWCEIDQATFESQLAPSIHILGDAAIAGAMPKSGFSAANQGRYCAFVVAALLADRPPPALSMINTCYSLAAPDYGFSVADVFRLGADGTIVAVEGAGGVSPLGASREFRKREADYTRGWYASISAEVWG